MRSPAILPVAQICLHTAHRNEHKEVPLAHHDSLVSSLLLLLPPLSTE
jgi:hypothetical protein